MRPTCLHSPPGACRASVFSLCITKYYHWKPSLPLYLYLTEVFFGCVRGGCVYVFTTFILQCFYKYSMSAVIFGVCVQRGVTADIKWWYFWAVSDGQACVSDKDRIVSLLPPFVFSPLDSEGLSCWWSCTHTVRPPKGGIYNWEEVQRQISGSYSHCTFSPPPTGIFSVTFSLAPRRRSPGDSRVLKTQKRVQGKLLYWFCR